LTSEFLSCRIQRMKNYAATYLQPLAAGLLALVMLIGLIGPAIKNPSPHDIPIGIVSGGGGGQFAFASNGSPFEVTTYDTERAARDAIDSRDIDGALVLGPSGPRLIVAGAAGDTVTGVITGAFTQILQQQGQKQGQTLQVEVVHPFAPGDSHGLILFFVVLAILVSALIANAIAGLGRAGGFASRLLIVLVFAAVAAPVAMGVATWIAGDYGSGFWTATALVALGSAAVGSVVAGAARLLGRPGVALAALIAVLLDLVCSGGPIGSQLLPDAYRQLAPGMPAGQLYSAIRGALYFDGAGLSAPITVLVLWLAAGVVLLLLGEVVARRRAAHG
jgi:hypothetical protein